MSPTATVPASDYGLDPALPITLDVTDGTPTFATWTQPLAGVSDQAQDALIVYLDSAADESYAVDDLIGDVEAFDRQSSLWCSATIEGDTLLVSINLDEVDVDDRDDVHDYLERFASTMRDTFNPDGPGRYFFDIPHDVLARMDPFEASKAFVTHFCPQSAWPTDTQRLTDTPFGEVIAARSAHRFVLYTPPECTGAYAFLLNGFIENGRLVEEQVVYFARPYRHKVTHDLPGSPERLEDVAVPLMKFMFDTYADTTGN